MSKERIVCPAIKYTLRNAGNNQFIERVVLCTNYDDSFIEEAVKEMKHNRFFYKYREERGFMTSEERFIGAKEAMFLALCKDQVAAVKQAWDEYVDIALSGCEYEEIEESEMRYRQTNERYLLKPLEPGDLYE